MSKVLIVGGGPAGMFASVFAARNGHEVHLYEQNEKLGKKLYITGKGRCNVTNDCDTEELFRHVLTNHKFLYSSFYSCNSQNVMRFFEQAGLALKTERGERVFPVSNHSSDVIRALEKEMKKSGVRIFLNKKVKDIKIERKSFHSLILEDGSNVKGDCVIIATGGISYPSTGATGDGYRFAKMAAHTVTPLLPSLVPLEVKEEYVKKLQGLSLKNVEISIKDKNKELYRDFGEMLFTHYGLSGPLILSASSHLVKRLNKEQLYLTIDLKPGLTQEQLDKRLLRDFEKYRNKQLKNALDDLLPAKIIPIIIELSKISPMKQVNEISKIERQCLLKALKEFPCTLTGYRGFNEAVITKGGISVKEISPSTMESKLIKNMYFAGEVLDVDALTGGFNLQIAWATAYTAGSQIL